MRGNRVRGEGRKSAKLTDQAVLDIRTRYRPNTKYSQRFFAIKYGVSKTTVAYVLSRRSWNHLQAE